MRVLVTGVNGFVGSHFAEYALNEGAEVWGACLPGSPMENVEHLAARLRLAECDLLAPGAARGVVEAVGADLVIHLAAQSSVSDSWRDPAATLSTNIIGQANLLEAVRLAPGRPRVIVVGSGDEYGRVEESELPVAETAPLRPLSPYALSKVAQDLMGYQYFRSHGLPIVRTRPFNHEGPRHAPVFAASGFARTIAEIEAGARPPVIEVGNLDVERDFSDVRDVVRAYWLLVERGEPGEVYNICSGRTWRLAAVLEFLLGESRVRPIEVRRDPARMRPNDVPVLCGDPSKIAKAAGWTAEIPFEETLRRVLDHWRGRIARGNRGDTS
jgi:GDP-4-dehydro-6-deoxy-D-mannose reductase